MANELACKCGECGNRWDWPQPVPMDMLEWTASLKKVRCPKCDAGHKKIKFLFGSAAAASPLSPSHSGDK